MRFHEGRQLIERIFFFFLCIEKIDGKIGRIGDLGPWNWKAQLHTHIDSSRPRIELPNNGGSGTSGGIGDGGDK